MDIAGLSTVLSMNELQTSWGVGMLSKSLDSLEQAGGELISMIDSVPPAMMELSVNPAIGSQFDMRI